MKVAFVVQRYGADVVGGAEALCRQVAERLSRSVEAHVLTSCALEYERWANYYPSGVEVLHGVMIHRFPVAGERDKQTFDRLTERLVGSGVRHGYPTDQVKWMEAQGPRVEALLDHIAERRDEYDVFVFFTYLYYTTYFGIQLVPEKSILVPTAHDEPPIYLELFRSIFQLPRALVFMADEERKFVHTQFANGHIPWAVIGMGIERPDGADGARFRARFGLSDPFILYAGRIEPSKNCQELFDFFARYKAEKGSDLKLVLLGRVEMPIPKNADIIPVGFVSDGDKFDAYKAAQVLVMPSRFESFSIVSLEALLVGTPLLVNGESAVLRDHCLRSTGGLFYQCYDEFAAALSLLLETPEMRRRLGQHGAEYVAQHYRWDAIEYRYLEILETVAHQPVPR